MQCVICKHGETLAGLATVTLTRDETVIVFRSVPADICQNCGEYYLSDEVTGTIFSRAETAIANGCEIEIQRYAA